MEKEKGSENVAMQHNFTDKRARDTNFSTPPTPPGQFCFCSKLYTDTQPVPQHKFIKKHTQRCLNVINIKINKVEHCFIAKNCSLFFGFSSRKAE